MPVERPTFSESWYRVADLRPHLRATVQVRRQHFRGQLWHVVQDPANNQFFRLSDSAYRFIGLLDGRRTVAEAWRIAMERLGGSAPTQGEVIQLLGQLYTSNLLRADLPPDAEGLFRRYRQRTRREVQGYLMNFLFVRIPLLDPDRFLDRWVGVFGKAFTWYGLAAWAVLIAVGLYFLVDRMDDFTKQASGVLTPSNLPLLYLGLILVKVIHEFGHAFACKRFGRLSGTGGEVHVMGVMLLVFTPLPYMDASSAWALRSKWHRAVVGMAGMMVEFAIAAVAAIVWSRTAEGTAAHALAYNIIFIASVSTLLFNANPLLRYDGYYILSDLVEVPNLAQRARQYLYYLVRKYVWGVRQVQDPSHTPGERVWFFFYAIASTVYRVFICAAIVLFVADKFQVIGMVLAVGAVVLWVLVPLGRFVHYLFMGSELARVRHRALLTTVAAAAVLALLVGLIPAPDRVRIEGVVEPVQLAIIHMGADGFVGDYLASGSPADPEGRPLLVASNPSLEALRDGLLAERRSLEARYRLAQTQEPAAAQTVAEQLAALQDQIAYVLKELDALVLKAPFSGTWVAPDIERLRGAYLRRKDRVGVVAVLDACIIRASAGQNVAARLVQEARPEVEIRVKGCPDIHRTGTIEKILPAGKEQLLSPALGDRAGGEIQTDRSDPKGTRAAERYFEVRVGLDPDDGTTLMPGQRVIVRVTTPPRPLLVQGWRWLLQLLQRRFQT